MAVSTTFSVIGAKIEEIPCIFPVQQGKWAAETSSLVTAPSAGESVLEREFRDRGGRDQLLGVD
jgi:hypothetical protein